MSRWKCKFLAVIELLLRIWSTHILLPRLTKFDSNIRERPVTSSLVMPSESLIRQRRISLFVNAHNLIITDEFSPKAQKEWIVKGIKSWS